MVDRHKAVIRSLQNNKVHDSGVDRGYHWDDSRKGYHYDEATDPQSAKDEYRQHERRNVAAVAKTPPQPQRPPPMQRPERKKPPPKFTRDMNTKAQLLGITTLFLLPLSFAISIIGYATPAWIIYNSRSMGLFQICDSNAANCESATSAVLFAADTSSIPDGMIFTWQFTSAFVGLGVACQFVAIFLLCCYPKIVYIDHRKLCLGTIICILVLISAGVIVAGAALFIVFYEDTNRVYPLSWSTYITMVGGCLAFITGLVFACHLCLIKR